MCEDVDLDRPIYLYFIEGEATLGTLDKYAKHWEMCEYSGLAITTELRRVGGNSISGPLLVSIERQAMDEDYYLDYTFTISGSSDTAACRIDGLA